MKKKSLTMLLTGLLAMSLTGVGFASWIIVQNDDDVKTGTVSVEIIEKYLVEINFEWADNNGDGEKNSTGDDILNFGYSKTKDGGNPTYNWLQNTDSTSEGSNPLEFYVHLNVDSNAATPVDPDVTLKLDIIDNDSKGYETATSTANSETNYIKKVGVAKVDASSNPEYEDLYTIRIEWGTAFEGENPYMYYNNQPYSDDLATQAVTKIGNLKELLKDVTFKLTIEAKFNLA